MNNREWIYNISPTERNPSKAVNLNDVEKCLDSFNSYWRCISMNAGGISTVYKWSLCTLISPFLLKMTLYVNKTMRLKILSWFNTSCKNPGAIAIWWQRQAEDEKNGATLSFHIKWTIKYYQFSFKSASTCWRVFLSLL